PRVGRSLGVAGPALAPGADLTVSGRAVAGDLLAVVGGMAGAAYMTLGERARARTSTTTYTTICYAVCAALLGAVCLAFRVPIHGFDLHTWLAIGALTAGPQLLGHSLLNFALHRVSATTVWVVLLVEARGAALLAGAGVGGARAGRRVPGLVLLVAGVGVVLVGAGGRRDRHNFREVVA